MKRLILLAQMLLLCLCASAQTADTMVRQAVAEQMSTYPASTLKDLYKSFFQDAFGPGHLISNAQDSEQRMRSYLEQECEMAKTEPNLCPDYELTGIHGRFYRVNLSVINDGRVPMESFLSAFLKSASQFSLPKVEDWRQEWISIEKSIRELGYRLPGQAQDSAAIMDILAQGKYASHHSEAYNAAYHPHYRLIEKEIFEREILPRLQFDIYLMIGQSNCAGRGYMTESDTTGIIPGVWLLNADGRPEPAKAPFNRYSNIRKDISMQMIGPAYSFAPAMHESTARNVLIIQNAKGGSGLWEWQNEDPAAVTFLDSTLMRAIPAMRYGKLKGIVWHQGETDTSHGTAGDIYVSRFSTMIERLRNALGVGAEVPILVGELGQWEWEKKELVDAFNDVTLPRLTQVVPNCHKIESDGLECRSTNHSDPHFSREANIELGKRYAQAIIKAQGCYRHYLPVNPNADQAARDLLERLYQTVDEGKIFSGLHHNQLMMPNYVRDLNRINEAVEGAVPMVWGGDVAWDADKVVQMATDHHQRGYLISITWHAARPFDHGVVRFKEQTQGRFTREQWEELVTEGSEMHSQWLAQVDSIAQYLKVLQDAGVPLLWRPFHEMNGEWFWWGDRRGERGFTVLWKMLYHRLTDYHKLNNLIWVWNPNNPRRHPVDKTMGYDLYYPGDEFVDVLAADVYHREWFQDTHDQLVELGKEKLVALGEVGELPTAEQLKSYNRYAWFMIWTDFTANKYNTIDALKDIFGNERVINIKE